MSCLLIGHRGHRIARWARRRRPEAAACAAALAEPENTAAAFDRALAAGCDGLELDLQPTRDGAIAIFHDTHWRRRALSAMTLAELRQAVPQVMELEQFLARYAHRCWLDLEVKGGGQGLEAALLAALRRHPPRHGYIVSSFQSRILKRLGELDPALPLCLNLRRPRALWRLRSTRVGWIAPQQNLCTAGYVRRLRAAGWRVLVWTVNSPRKMRRLARAGADALCSDQPYLLVDALRPERREAETGKTSGH